MASNVRKFKRAGAQQKADEFEVTIGQLFDSAEALQVLINTRVDGIVRLRLRRIVDQVKPALDSFNATRLDLAAQYGELSEDRQQWTFPDEEKAKLFWEEFNKLRAHPEKIQGQKFNPIAFASAQISVAEEESLAWIFVE